jgi:hypothetical protein
MQIPADLKVSKFSFEDISEDEQLNLVLPESAKGESVLE